MKHLNWQITFSSNSLHTMTTQIHKSYKFFNDENNNVIDMNINEIENVTNKHCVKTEGTIVGMENMKINQ